LSAHLLSSLIQASTLKIFPTSPFQVKQEAAMSSDPSNPSRNTRQTAQKRTATIEDEDSPPIIKRRVAPRIPNANPGPSSNGVTPVRLFPQGVAVKKKRRLNFA
jgi:hypothetical protein